MSRFACVSAQIVFRVMLVKVMFDPCFNYASTIMYLNILDAISKSRFTDRVPGLYGVGLQTKAKCAMLTSIKTQ